MVEVTFGEGTEKYMVQPFGLDVDEDGYVVDQDGDILTDGYGTPIEAENIGAVISLKHHGFSVNDEGVVINHKKEPVSFTTDEGTGSKEDSIIPFRTDEGELSGIVRDDFCSMTDFVSASISEDNSGQKSL